MVPVYLHFHPEGGYSMVLLNFGIVPHHYMMSQTYKTMKTSNFTYIQHGSLENF